MSAIALAVRFARRELRSGLAGFRIFLAALTLGVAAIAGVGSLGQAFLVGLSEQGRTLLGGDIRLQRMYQPADETERKFLASYGRITETAALRSMAADGRDPNKRTLIELKAVDPSYPLLGQTVLEPAMPLQNAIACDAQSCGAAVEEALGPAPVEIDELIRQLRAPAAALLTVILELELAGRCLRHPGNRVSWK